MKESDGSVGLWRWLFQDWSANAGYRDSRLILLLFRSAQWARSHWGPLGHLYVAAYRLASSLIGVELPAESFIGPRLRLYHPQGIVLNAGVRLGSDCILRHNVTLGNYRRSDGSDSGVPKVGDGVEFGAGCAVIGPVRIGDGALVCALALVTGNVPPGGVMLGNPARLTRIRASV